MPPLRRGFTRTEQSGLLHLHHNRLLGIDRDAGKQAQAIAAARWRNTGGADWAEAEPARRPSG
ncbi:hypothetical protein [Kitasatospora sp. HPMI-4]|uniref:hypothetical protein n=1 Tax=Kitasatospora sp. HPMI-4 TaxID=3448443 RepID=UPI003F1D55F9